MKDNDYLKNMAAFEQAAAGMRPVANMLYGYFTALTENGFSRNEALQLAKSLQEKVWEISLQTGRQADEE